MTAHEFRQLALGIPGATESAHMNHPDFRLGGRIFASLGFPDDDWAMVKLTPEEQRYFIDRAPRVFSPCNGAWGRQGSTNVHLASAKNPILCDALESAAKGVAKNAAKAVPKTVAKGVAGKTKVAAKPAAIPAKKKPRRKA